MVVPRRNKAYNSCSYSKFSNNVLKAKFIDKDAKYTTELWLERVVIAGLTKEPKTATIEYGSKTETLEIHLHNFENDKAFVVRKPGVNMAESFTITLNY